MFLVKNVRKAGSCLGMRYGGMHTLEQTKGDPQKVDRALRCCWFLSCKGNIGARARSDFHLSYQEMRIFR